MIKIKYPKSKSERKKFEDDYKNIWQSNLQNYNRRLTHLLNSNTQYNHLNTHTFEQILTAPFHELQNIASAYKGVAFSDGDFRELKSIFNYDYKKTKNNSYGSKYSTKIAIFFRNWADQLNLCTCYFCNIDYVNTYSTLEDHLPFVEFLNTADVGSLEYINGISETIATEIHNKNLEGTTKTKFTCEDDLLFISGIARLTKQKIVDFYTKKNEYGNFTLDHLIDKGENPILALSLYNFVPSCYVCNSKIKGSKELVETNSQVDLSPTHKDFNFNKDAKFTLKFTMKNHDKEKLVTQANISSLRKNNLRLDIEAINGYNKYVEFFRLKGRYQFHIQEATNLIELKKKYSNSQLNKITKLLNHGKSNPSHTKAILRDIFGKELFEGDIQERSFTKLKRDIARQIGIEGVKED